MRRRAMTIGVTLIVAGQMLAASFVAGEAASRESRFLRSLKQLAPEDRLVQLCDYKVLQRIGKEHRKIYRPDRAVAGARADGRGRRLPQPRQMVRVLLHLHRRARPPEGVVAQI
jgi:hypothetical protein